MVLPPDVIELASKTTVSWQSGTEAPEAPPELPDQLVVADQLPPDVATQYLVVGAVKEIPEFPKASPRDVPVKSAAAPAPVIS